jgi:hypothetical protein
MKRKQVETPLAHLSTYTDERGTHWTVIYMASPVCKELDTEAEARNIWEMLRRREKGIPEHAPIWDGDKGEYH